MTEAKIYLNVPFAEKDQAKALGARWDAANKKWYVPGGKNAGAFAKWLSGTGAVEFPAAAAKEPKPRTSSFVNTGSVNNEAGGVVTHSTDKDFAAYNGDTPPWD